MGEESAGVKENISYGMVGREGDNALEGKEGGGGGGGGEHIGK